MQADGGAQHALTPGNSESFDPAWMADSQQLTLVMAGSRFTVHRDGTLLSEQAALPAIYSGAGNYAFTPAPDGSQIAFVHQAGECQQEHCTRHIFVAKIDGSDLRQITFGTTTDDGSDMFNDNPVWSPDSTRLVFVSNRGADMRLYVTSATGGAARHLTDNSSIYSSLQWLVVPNPPRPTPVARAATTTPLPRLPHGTLVVALRRAGANRFDLYRIATPSGDMIRMTSGGENNTAPALSPDGTRIAYISERAGDTVLALTNRDGSSFTRLARGVRASDPIDHVAWSPDGTQLVFAQNCGLYTIRADGSDRQALLEPVADACYNDPNWSPDGTRIIFAATADSSHSAIFSIAAGGGQATNVTEYVGQPGSEQSPIFSPDGTMIAFVSAREGAAHVYLVHADGTNLRRLTTAWLADDSPAWSPDGAWIACMATSEAGPSLLAIAVDGGGNATLPNLVSGDYEQPVWGQ